MFMRCRIPVLPLLSFFFSLAFTAEAGAGIFSIDRCTEVVTELEDPLTPLGDRSADWVAEIVCEGVKKLAPKFGVYLDGRFMLKLFICESNESFLKRTGRGKWALAVFHPRMGIVTQPAHWLYRLGKRKMLERTVTHELVHFFVHKVTGGRCPRWLNEGLAQWMSGLQPETPVLVPLKRVEELELSWRIDSHNPKKLAGNYRLSLLLTAKIIRRAGLEALLEALPDMPGYPPCGLDLPVAGRPIKYWLMVAEPQVEDQAADRQVRILYGEHWLDILEDEARARPTRLDGPQSRVPALERFRKSKRRRPQNPSE